MQKVPGNEISGAIIERLKSLRKPDRIFAVILIGDSAMSLNFISQKETIAKELALDFRLYKFSTGLTNDDLREEVGKIANQNSVGGVVVQLPLPDYINKQYILNSVPREKDVDVLGERALGAFYAGRNPVLPPAVGAISYIVEKYDLKLERLKVAVVGLGTLIGKPVAVWFMGRVHNLNLLDSRGDIASIRNADLVISGVGKANLIDPHILKKGASVIDFGYDYIKDKLYGDLNTSSELELEHLNIYTPTPGGTGPILVAKLFENFYRLNNETI